MRLSYFVKIFLITILTTASLFASLDKKSAIVYYGEHLSYPFVGIHDYIIVEPENIKTYTTGFKRFQQNIYAYLSVNEVDPNSSYAKEIKDSWVLTKNSAWNSKVLNIANKEYQDFLLERLEKLKKRGFKNFFFDTMDSYQLANVNKDDKEYLKNSLAKFIKRVKKRFPNSKLIVNRGFELIDQIYPYIEAMLFESYYYGYDAANKRYKKVSKEDRDWLDLQLKKVSSYHIPIIALDYISLSDKKLIKEDIKALEQRGFIPYISEPSLTVYGYSSKNAIKREILTIYNRTDLEDNNYIGQSYSHLLVQTPLEYMGYIARLTDANTQLPFSSDLSNRYAGAIIWLEKPLKDMNKLNKWIEFATKQRLKVLLLGSSSIDINSPTIKNLGISVVKNRSDRFDKLSIVKKDKMLDFELKAHPKFQTDYFKAKNAKVLYSYKNTKNQLNISAAITPWGGFARDDALISSYEDISVWIINPFQLFQKSLKLKIMPSPDPTTENGKRLAFIHLDGDASMNRVEENPKELSIERFLNHFIKKYKLPQSISIVESETAPHGKYPKLSKRLESAAKKIYSYPYVEQATHTFSHPYFWRELEEDPKNPKYRTHLPYPYKFSLKREIDESLNYINKKLAPNKKPSKLLFWSGDCYPSESELKYTYKHGFININGGDTQIINDKPWLSLIQPYGIGLGDFYQVFTGQQNENVYTNDWLGPFWAFKKVKQTFDLTNRPRRLKPIDLYFHFYSVSKTAAEEALRLNYEWLRKQDANFIFTSSYPPKVTNFYDISIANENNRWLYCGFGDLRTIRMPKSLGYPNLKESVGIVGYNTFNDSFYLHLSGAFKTLLTISKTKKESNHLISANGRLISYKNGSYHFKSHTPLKLSFYLKKGCYLKSSAKAKVIKKGRVTTLKYKNAKDVNVKIICK